MDYKPIITTHQDFLPKLELRPIILPSLFHCIHACLSLLNTVGYLEYDTSSVCKNIFQKTRLRHFFWWLCARTIKKYITEYSHVRVDRKLYSMVTLQNLKIVSLSSPQLILWNKHGEDTDETQLWNILVCKRTTQHLSRIQARKLVWETMTLERKITALYAMLGTLCCRSISETLKSKSV